jgi:hypothetical protein
MLGSEILIQRGEVEERLETEQVHFIRHPFTNNIKLQGMRLAEAEMYDPPWINHLLRLEMSKCEHTYIWKVNTATPEYK